MHQLTRLSLRNRAVVFLTTLAIVLVGGLAMGTLRTELIPSLQFPAAVVIGSYPGAAPQIVADRLTKPIEQAVRGVPGVKDISAQSSQSVATVMVEFAYGTDMDQANLKLTTQLARLTTSLPDTAQTQVITGTLDDLPVLQLAITGRDAAATAQTLAKTVKGDLVPRLEQLDDVRQVSLSGFSPPVITITPDPAALAAHGQTIADLTNLLRSYGLQAPAGSVSEADSNLPVVVGAPLSSVEQLSQLSLPGQIPVPSDDPAATSVQSQAVPLTDVAKVEQTVAPADSLSRWDGRPAVAVAITKTAAGNIVAVSQAVKDLLAESAPVFEQAGLNVAVAFDQAPFITDSITGLTEEGLIGLAFAVLIILVFLLSFRATIVSALAIPLSLLATFGVLKATGNSLNILTLGAMTIAIGRVVDDAIVVIENIKRHLSYGEDKTHAITQAVREVGGAIAASTICTIAVFAPIALVGGIVGELFRPFAITVAVALAASLLVALTIVPVLAFWFVKAPVTLDEADQQTLAAQMVSKEKHGIWQRLYLPTVRGAVRHPVIALLLACLILGGTAWQVPQLKMNFMGSTGQNTLTVTQTFQPGISLATRAAQTEPVEAALLSNPNVSGVQTTIGGAGLLGMSLGSNATFAVTLKAGSDQDSATAEIRQAITGLAGANTSTLTVDQGQSMIGSSTVDLIVRSADATVLAEAAQQVAELAQRTDGASDVTTTLTADLPSIQIDVDTAMAASLGLTEASVVGLVSAAMTPTTLGSLETADGAVNVTLAPSVASPESQADLAQLPLLTTPTGQVVTLSEVAKVQKIAQPSTLTRSNGQPSVTVSLTPTTDDLMGLANQLRTSLDQIDLPPGVTVAVAGVAAEQSAAFRDLGIALAVAVAIVYIVMVATFGSLLQPLILLVAIPFAATGALGALLLSDTAVGVPALIGALMLVGIVVSNAIVLIDRINQVRRQSDLALVDAIVEGARVRLRPVIMTAAATVCALIPMAVGWTGHSAFLSQPLALIVIGGLVSSTLLTLVIVPVLYRFVGAGEQRRSRRRAERLAKAQQRRRESLGQAAPIQPAIATAAPVTPSSHSADLSAVSRQPLADRLQTLPDWQDVIGQPTSDPAEITAPTWLDQLSEQPEPVEPPLFSDSHTPADLRPAQPAELLHSGEPVDVEQAHPSEPIEAELSHPAELAAAELTHLSKPTVAEQTHLAEPAAGAHVHPAELADVEQAHRAEPAVTALLHPAEPA
ncbi:MAG: efflux RND transporter permease subunit, partial [Bifidobacteriaceae bacterium]|nr:efflux RND transporter permease subunit [Bifidobacteriaceae bacterium]